MKTRSSRSRKKAMNNDDSEDYLIPPSTGDDLNATHTCTTTTASPKKIPSDAYYGEYHGHNVKHLEIVAAHLRETHCGPLIFLAGDSSLDNKFWFADEENAVNGYEDILTPKRSLVDIAHCMNKEIVKRHLDHKLAVINASIEESTIGSRARGKLLPQDVFIRDNISAHDVLVVSLGGNDVALKPSPCTALSMISLLCCSTASCLDTRSCVCATLPCDDPCMGCCCGCASNLLACPLGLGYFVHLFGTRLEAVVRNMVSKTKPKLVVICMIYYLDEESSGNSWANTTLSLLGYNSNPAKLQAAIRQMYTKATRNINIPGTKVIAVPLFESLNGKDTRDYAQRVEPSAIGGRKMAVQLVDAILSATDNNDNGSIPAASTGAESSGYTMQR